MPSTELKQWLKEVEDIETQLAFIESEKEQLHGRCFNCHHRYKISKEMVKKIEEVKKTCELLAFSER